METGQEKTVVASNPLRVLTVGTLAEIRSERIRALVADLGRACKEEGDYTFVFGLNQITEAVVISRGLTKAAGLRVGELFIEVVNQ